MANGNEHQALFAQLYAHATINQAIGILKVRLDTSIDEATTYLVETAELLDMTPLDFATEVVASVS